MPTLEKVIVLTDAAHLPETSLPNVVAFEEWLAEADGDFRKPTDELAASAIARPARPAIRKASSTATGQRTACDDRGDAGPMGVSARMSSCPLCRCSTPMLGRHADPWSATKMVMRAAAWTGSI